MEPPMDPPTSASDSRRARWLIGILVFLLVVFTAVVQQSGSSALQSAGGAGAADAIPPPKPEFDLMARTLGKIALSDPEFRSVGVMGVQNLDQLARSDVDKFRVALFVGGVSGAPAGSGSLDKPPADGSDAFRERIEAVESDLPEDSPLRPHVAIARAIYLGEGERPDAATLDAFAKEHGWVGRLTATHGLPETDAERERVVSGGLALLLFIGVVVCGGSVAFAAGLTLLIVGLVLGAQGRLPSRVVPPPLEGRGSAVLLEMVALFIAGFLALKGIGEIVASSLGAGAAVWFSLLGQWLLLLVLLWPAVRGLPRAAERVGLTRGRGVLREVGAGVVGYLACLPILVCGALVSVVLMLAWELVRTRVLHQPPADPPENAIIDIVTEQRKSWIMLVFFLLAALWAPIAEESVFRGALFGHLRARWHWFPGAVVTALAFGLMHNYPVLMLGGVTALGFGFCLLREWRGSLIAPMTAHAIHNAGLLTVLLVFLSLLGDGD